MSEKIEKLIDEALKAEPAFKLRGDFRDRVVQTIKRKEQGSQRKFYFFLLFGMIMMSGFGYALFKYYFPQMQMMEGFKEVNSLIPYAILGGVVIAVIQFLDKKLVKDRLTPHV